MFWKLQLNKSLSADFIWKAIHVGATFSLSLYLFFTAVYLCICTGTWSFNSAINSVCTDSPEAAVKMGRLEGETVT